MKTLFIAVIVLLSCSYSFSQVTDSEIARSLLGKAEYQVNPILDSLGVWYARHVVESEERLSRVFSIADGDGTVKVWTLKLNKSGSRFDKVVINYRHDDREQVEDRNKVTGSSGLHVGKYSTDIHFSLK